MKRLIRIANLTSYLLFTCILLYCRFLKSLSEERTPCVLGLFLLIEMVGMENMARQRILIKMYVYLAVRGGSLALVGNTYYLLAPAGVKIGQCKLCESWSVPEHLRILPCVEVQSSYLHPIIYSYQLCLCFALLINPALATNQCGMSDVDEHGYTKYTVHFMYVWFHFRVGFFVYTKYQPCTSSCRVLILL